MNRLNLFVVVIVTLSACQFTTQAAERIVLDPSNWDEYVPDGKEVDSIYGDIVLRNDKIEAVIARPISGRNANMTVRNVAGAVIDLTKRTSSNDQLSAFFPTAATYPIREIPDDDGKEFTTTQRAAQVAYDCRSEQIDGKPTVTLSYRLQDGDAFLSLATTYSNPHDQDIQFELLDSIRADTSFDFGTDSVTGLFWAHDNWWRQAIGLLVDDVAIDFVGDSLTKKRPVLKYIRGDSSIVTLKPTETMTLNSKIIPADHQLELFGIAQQIKGLESNHIKLRITDLAGPIDNAKVDLHSASGFYATGTTDKTGTIEFDLPRRDFRVEVIAVGRPREDLTLKADGDVSVGIKMELPGYVVAKITDEAGEPIPCKIEFRAKDGEKNPYFGPDGMIYGVRNLRYTHDGTFRQVITPGEYDVIISRGNEYDAVFESIKVELGKEALLTAILKRSVDTPGWVSSDFHSHSSPSGDNTSEQRGRVLNLIAENIEFGPCTEHNRISTYADHIRFFRAEQFMATCSGMELTGSPLPVNHQNTFPLIRRPRTQDGGGPVTDTNPVVQIERLALWDGNSDKLLQQNHPNLAQIYGDRDADGNPDGGFEKMFAYMDVIEVHPPGLILKELEDGTNGNDNRIFRWLQLLNLGYRIPGVVNTDAHYNFHGSGWLRNYIKSSTDKPEEISIEEMVDSSEAGNVIMTNGPYLEVTASNTDRNTSIAGGDLTASDGKIEIDVRVQCANWLDINRVQVLVNGNRDPNLNFTRATSPGMFKTGVVKFHQQIPVKLDSDAYLIVVAIGDGLKLGAVMGPDHANDVPTAVANPIFVDVDGGGFSFSKDLLGKPLPQSNETAQKPQGVEKWAEAIAAFKEQDANSPPKKGGIVFVGSSSIRLWDLKKHFPDRNAINRGFGGSQMSDSLYYADQIVLPYEPRVIVVYAGDNDIAAGETAELVHSDFNAFVKKVHAELPDCRILFVAVKPSIKRWNLVAEVRKANQLIRTEAESNPLLEFIDVDTPMIGDDGMPKKELFVEDGLHLNEAGYTLWSGLVREKL